MDHRAHQSWKILYSYKTDLKSSETIDNNELFIFLSRWSFDLKSINWESFQYQPSKFDSVWFKTTAKIFSENFYRFLPRIHENLNAWKWV